jgi:hypothetical protein
MKDCLDERCKFLPLERKLSLFDPISWGHLLEIIQRANGSRTTQVTEASSLENVFFFLKIIHLSLLLEHHFYILSDSLPVSNEHVSYSLLRRDIQVFPFVGFRIAITRKDDLRT